MKHDVILRNLVLAALLANFATAPAFAQAAATEKDQAELEARLEAARAKLEEAAREVAELSGELTGPVMHDFVIAHSMGRRAMLGINIGGDQDAKGGVPVQSVTPGGPASTAGLKAGDVIVGIDGKNLRAEKEPSSALVAHLRTVQPGDKVKVEYLRDGKTQTAEITTGTMGAGRMMAMPAIGPFMGVPPVPPVGGGPYGMGFHAFGRSQILDMELVTLTPKLGRYFGTDKGVLVVRPPRSGDFKLEEGDVIVDIDGRKPENGGHALRILRSYQPGEKVTLNILRDRKPVKLAVTLPARSTAEPEEGAFFFDEPVPFTKPLPPPEEDAT
jgi:predicted metalloprotease with PDZ domain